MSTVENPPPVRPARAPQKPRIGVVSGRYPASQFEAYVNHRAYCARHGYTYMYCNWPTGAANRYLNKLQYVKEYYELFDFLFWIDDDAFFMRLDEPLDAFLPKEDRFLSICASPTVNGLHTYVSSGQFVLRCSPTGRSFIDEVERVDLAKVRAWWRDELGYFTNGDQDSFVYLMHTDARFAAYDRHEYHAFNSRADDVLAGSDVFLLHITGTVPAKEEKYRRVQRHLRRGPSLLPEAEAKRWNLATPPSLPRRLASRLRQLARSRR